MLVLVACSLLALGCAEGLVRLLADRPRVNDVQIADDHLGYRFPSATVPCRDEQGIFPFVINSAGFRGPELPPPGSESSGAARVLLLGDSFLNGWRIRDEDWVRTRVQETLRRAGRAAEVYALGMDDFGTGQELLALREFGPRVRPEQVVLLLYPGNDLLNNTLEMAGRSSISTGDYFRPYLVPGEGGELEVRYALPWRALLRRSYLFRHIEVRWLAGRSFDRLRATLTGEPVLQSHERVAAGQLHDEYLELFCPARADERWDVAWRRTETLLLALRDEAEQLGATLTIAVIPALEQVLRSAQQMAEQTQQRVCGWEPADMALDLDAPERRLEEFFHRHGLAHAVLLGPLRAEVAATRAPVYMNEGHLNPAGHRVLGERIGARLVPGASDLCHEPGGPADPFAMLGDPPLALDFRRDAHWPLFAWGFRDWTSPAQDASNPGWECGSRGLFLAHCGLVTLEGTVREGSTLPVTVTVARQAREERLTALTLAAAGPFRLSFELLRWGDEIWTPLWLMAEPASGANGGTARVVVQGMQCVPGTARMPRQRFGARLGKHLLVLPAGFLAFAQWGFVPALR